MAGLGGAVICVVALGCLLMSAAGVLCVVWCVALKQIDGIQK